MIQILFCEDPGIVRILYFIKVALNILKFVIPIGLIVMITLDVYKNMLNGYIDNKESIIKKSGNRILACIIVFCVPTCINLLCALISKIGINADKYNADFLTCYTEASRELIDELETIEELKLNEEEEKKRKEAALIAADIKAKQQAQIEANKSNSSGSGSSGSFSNLTDLKKQNLVYVQNGVFYAPGYKNGKPNTYSGKQCPSNPLQQGYNNKYGYNNYFYTMLQNLIEGAKKAGYNLKISTQGCRSYQTQVEYYKKYEKGRAASPGKSNHGWGVASDVTFYKNATQTCGSYRTRSNCPGMAWVHDHAKDYGLHFPLLTANYKEDWHVEPIHLKKY